MTDEPTTRMLVLVDAPGRADAVLSLAERYTTAPETLTPAGTDLTAPLTTAVGGEAPPSLSPMIDQLLDAAAYRQIPWVGIRRDLAPAADLLRELLVATGRHSSETVPGFAVFLAQGEVPPLRRILAIVDRSHGPISGLLAHTAVTLAEAAGAELDVLILAAHGEDLSAEDEHDALAINRERELYEQAVARATAAGLRVNWLTAAAVADSWTVITNQMMQSRYDLVIDDLGDVTLGGALRRGSALDQVLSPGQVGEIPLRLLTEYFGPVLLVIDGIRLGMAPAAILRAGAVAALAIGVVSSGLAPGLTAAVSQAAQVGGPDPIDELRSELQDALASNVVDRAKRAETASRSAARASAVSSGRAPTAPKGGADPSDVERARVELRSSETRLRKAQRSLNRAKARLAEAKDDRDTAQEHVVSALAELEAAQAAQAERATAAQLAREDASGLTGVLPGGASRGDAELAEARAQVASFRLDRAIQEGEEALADLDAADQEIERATELLNIARSRTAKLNAEYAFDKQTLQVYRESLADSRQAPLRSGSYRISARFGQAGGLWSSGYHTGLDFAGASGTDIMAAASGRVVSAGWAGAYGNRIEIDHGGGVVTTYNHLSRINVSVGQKVYTGDHIGDLGSTGNSTGPHLHFEVTRNGSFVDPQAWLGW